MVDIFFIGANVCESTRVVWRGAGKLVQLLYKLLQHLRSLDRSLTLFTLE